jgi:hypothetical protein
MISGGLVILWEMNEKDSLATQVVGVVPMQSHWNLNTEQRLRRKTDKGAIPILLLFALCVFTFDSKAQNVINRTYIEDRPVILFSSVVNVGATYHVIGVTGETGISSNYDRIFLGEMDQAGSISKYDAIYDSVLKGYSAFLNALIENNHGELVSTGYSFDTAFNVVLLRKDLVTDSIHMWEYYTPNSYAFYGFNVVEYGTHYFRRSKNG